MCCSVCINTLLHRRWICYWSVVLVQNPERIYTDGNVLSHGGDGGWWALGGITYQCSQCKNMYINRWQWQCMLHGQQLLLGSRCLSLLFLHQCHCNITYIKYVWHNSITLLIVFPSVLLKNIKLRSSTPYACFLKEFGFDFSSKNMLSFWLSIIFWGVLFLQI